MKYEEWLKNWLNDYVKTTGKGKTYIRYYEIVYQHIIPNLGKYDFNELTPVIIQKFITYLSQRGNLKTGCGLSSNSINSIITVIQSSLDTANRIGLSEVDIRNKIKRPKTIEKKVSCFTHDEQKKIEQAVLNSKKHKLFGIIVCLYSGLRLGEVLALKWDDIDFSKYELTVDKTCYDGRDKNGNPCRIVNSAKTASSNRVIPIPKKLMPYLKKIKSKNISDYVINNDDNKMISVRSYQKSFSLLLKKLHINHRGFHSLRHTFATRALECGMDIKTLSEILGHKSPTITLNRYVHSFMEYKKEMMDKVATFL